jgi:diguanylate cyclase (GGDEF)-like protein/putative nucleotidyltransferase with HDIG domain
MQESAARPAKILTINRNDTIKNAAALMLAHNVGCLIVNDDNGQFIGLVSERDVAHHVANASDAGQLPVAHIMTGRVISCPPGTPTHEARRIMADHRVRHLPIVERGVVIGILSARDVMAQQLLEDRAAAEEVAVLSKCLKSIDLQEAVEIVAAETPKLFDARCCVLCLYPDGDTTKPPELVSSNRCPCADCGRSMIDGGFTPVCWQATQSADQGGLFFDETPAECTEHGGCPPRLVLPIEITGLPPMQGGREKRLAGFVCMCGLGPACTANKELTSYKAKLATEILVAHLTNAMRYQQARLTSLTDALTGVGSRKLLEDKLQAECDRAKRYKRPFSVAILDLDHFKMINDTLGHAAGDEAIRQLAQCINERKRATDVLARYGGDEFVLLMPETQAAEAAVLMERIRINVQQIPLEQGLTLSLSCGISESQLQQDSAPGDVMRRADLALYEAKNAGRNCIKLWNKDMGRSLSTGEVEIERIQRLQRRIIGLSEKAEKMFMESIWGLVQALEAKDLYAKKHSENVMRYAAAITRMMELGPKQSDLIRRAAMIHDIGRIGIPDSILFKPGVLTPHERRIIEQHPIIAARILEPMSFLEREVAIIRHHHEKWNGQGYPDGLARTAIPLGARIIAVADTFDALTSDRAYHTQRPVREAIRILKDSADYELDPAVVTAMLAWIDSLAKQLDKASEDLTVEELLAARPSAVPELTPPLVTPSVLASPASA